MYVTTVAFYLTPIDTSLIRINDHLVSVSKELHSNFRSPPMKTLDRSVEMLGLEW